MIHIIHLFWIIPLSILLGFAVTAYLYLSKHDQEEWDGLVFDEDWYAMFEEE